MRLLESIFDDDVDVYSGDNYDYLANMVAQYVGSAVGDDHPIKGSRDGDVLVIMPGAQWAQLRLTAALPSDLPVKSIRIETKNCLFLEPHILDGLNLETSGDAVINVPKNMSKIVIKNCNIKCMDFTIYTYWARSVVEIKNSHIEGIGYNRKIKFSDINKLTIDKSSTFKGINILYLHYPTGDMLDRVRQLAPISEINDIDDLYYRTATDEETEQYRLQDIHKILGLDRNAWSSLQNIVIGPSTSDHGIYLCRGRVSAPLKGFAGSYKMLCKNRWVLWLTYNVNDIIY